MKPLQIAVALFLFFQYGCQSSQPMEKEETYTFLDSLYENHQYFTLRDEFEKEKSGLTDVQRLMLQAKINAVFAKRERSNEAIDSLLIAYKEQVPDSLKIDLMKIRARNAMLLNNYQVALSTTDQLLEFGELLTEEEKDDYKNDAIIYRELRDMPKQTADVTSTRLSISKDLAGLSRIPVVINGVEQASVFDTGANISVISDSLAQKCGLSVLQNSFKVDALTGRQVDAKIAVADVVKLGNTILKNVVFMVFPEQSLSFPQINYKIEAIIGFPVIQALKEVQIVKDSVLYIPKETTESAHQNMALDFLTPVVDVSRGGRSLPFTFDTGATSTQLDKEYFDLYEDEIKASGRIDSIQFAGAGGGRAVKAYRAPFSGTIAGQTFKVDTVDIFFDEDILRYKGVFGNLGKDVLTQFDTITLNFERMFLELK